MSNKTTKNTLTTGNTVNTLTGEVFNDPFEGKDINELLTKLDNQTGIDVLERAIQLIPHKTKNNGEEMNITNIYFLFKISDALSKYVIKDYPFKSFTNEAGIFVEGRPAGKSLIPVAKTILDFYGISYPKGYLEEQLEKLNAAYGFNS